MIPILYNGNETKFKTNGIGRLSDAILCEVTEERNGTYELYLRYPVTGALYPELKNSRQILVMPSDGANEQPFRIYRISKPLNGIVDVYAEHVSYRLSHIPVTPFSAENVQSALLGLKGYAAEDCPFEFDTDKATAGSFTVSEPASVRSRLGGNSGSVLDVFGGEYSFDRYQVYLHNNRGSDNGVTIRYGKNLTDLKQEENIQNTITGILPYYKDSDGNVMTLPEKTISVANAANYPYKRTIPKDLSGEFEEKPTEDQLRSAAEQYVKKNDIGVPTVNITVSFQPLWQTEEYKNVAPVEHVKLCDTVSVEYELLGVSAKAKVTKTVYDVLQGRYKSIELGEAKSNLATTIIEQKKEVEEKPSITVLENAILAATEQIAGIKGGYIVFRYDANKQPYEMLIMDTDDITTAKNVWRFNQAGIGHSSSGYEGPFTTAITQDGKIVAGFITTGTMYADRIKGGALVMGGNGNENGAFYVKDEKGNIIITFDSGGITMADGTYINWKNIDGAPDIPTNNNQLTNGAGYTTMAAVEGKGYQNANQVTQITKNTVTTSYVNALGVTAKYIAAENITGSIISGKQIEANYTQSASGYPASGFRVQTDGTAKIYYVSAHAVSVETDLHANGDITSDSNIRANNGQVIGYYVGAGAGGIATTGTKARIPDTKSYGTKTLYCYETTSPFFGDIGEGRTDENGQCMIFIDDVLAETINTETCEYQVFLSPYGKGNLYVSERTATYFMVVGTSDMLFGWELKARQLGYEYERLETHEAPEQAEDILDTALSEIEVEQIDTLNTALDLMQAEQEELTDD